jgi:signal transduction histidine kinase
MKSLRCRLTLWFGISLLVVVTGLIGAAHRHLDYELRQEKWELTTPDHRDWVLHGSFTDKEVQDILGELVKFWILVGVPLVGLALVSAYFIARRSDRPLREVNRQLARLGPATLAERLQAPDMDPEVGELVRHVNDLLARLELVFTHLREYTAQVAHELRTPLQLMRLRIEANAARMSPELAEELQEELARLSSYVETALTMARAEQGRLEVRPEPLALKELLTDVLEPFSRLAEAQGRRLLWFCPLNVIIQADRGMLKQILFNLLSNALKHGEKDILLRVRARPRSVSLLVGNRAAERTQASQQGLGIGLRLVRALANQMERIGLAIRPQRFFWVRLQLPPREGGPAPAKLRSPSQRLSSLMGSTATLDKTNRVYQTFEERGPTQVPVLPGTPKFPCGSASRDLTGNQTRRLQPNSYRR